MDLHGLGIGARHDDRRTGAAFRADGAEQVGRLGAQVLGHRRPAAAARPAPGARVLLAQLLQFGPRRRRKAAETLSFSRPPVQCGAKTWSSTTIFAVDFD